MTSLIRRLSIPPRSSKVHAVTRCIQALVAVAFITLLLYCYFNKGWWLDINVPLQVGLITFCATLIYTGYCLMRRPFDFGSPHHAQASAHPASGWALHLWVYLFAFIELVCAIAWIATAVTMCFSKGKDFKEMFVRPPYGLWVGAVVLSGLDGLMFAWSTYMIWRERQGARNRFSAWGVELNQNEADAPYARV